MRLLIRKMEDFGSIDRFFKLLGLTRRSTLPGRYPLTLTRSSLDDIKAHPTHWFVAEKTDGERAMLWFDSCRRTVVLVTRSLKLEPLQMKPPPPIDASTTAVDSDEPSCFVLDGEFVKQQSSSSSSSSSSQFVVFDLVSINNKPISAIDQISYPERLNQAKQCVRRIADSLVGIAVNLKTVYPVVDIGVLVGRLLRRATRTPTDGVVFTPATNGTGPGCCYKWKPPGSHTVDLLIKPPFFDHRGFLSTYCLAYEGTSGAVTLVTFQSIQVSPEDRVVCAGLDRPAVVETKFHNGRWRLLKQRPDKTKPNFIHVIVNCLEAEADRIVYHELVW